MSEELSDRTPRLLNNIRFKIGLYIQGVANLFFPDHLLVLRNNRIKRINAKFTREPFKCWINKNKEGDAEIFKSNNRLRFGSNDTELMYSDIDQLVDPASIKATEVVKEDDEVREALEEGELEGIPIEKERSYLDPSYLQNTNPYSIDSNTFRQVYSDAEESVKNMIPDEDSALKEVGKAVTFVFLGFLITYIAMGQGGGSGGGSIGGSIPLMIELFL